MPPAIVFVDEIDAVGRHRGAGMARPRRAEQTNQLLVEMDGFDVTDGVILIAATNRPDIPTRRCCAWPLRPADRRRGARTCRRHPRIPGVMRQAA